MTLYDKDVPIYRVGYVLVRHTVLPHKSLLVSSADIYQKPVGLEIDLVQEFILVVG